MCFYKKKIYFFWKYFKNMSFVILGVPPPPPPPKLEGGVLIFEIWKKRGSQKNCPEVGGLVERGRGGGSLRKRGFPNCFITFP